MTAVADQVCAAERECVACRDMKPATTEFFYRCTDESRGFLRPKCIECCRVDARARSAKRSKRKAVRFDVPFPHLPVAPLAAAILREIEREDHRLRPWEGSRIGSRARLAAGSVTRTCAGLGVSPDSYRNWIGAQTKFVEFDTADAILQRAGWLWWEVWAMPEPSGPVLAYLDAAEAHGLAMVAFEGDDDDNG